MPVARICPTCGTGFSVAPSRIARGEGTYCSRACSNPARGRGGTANPNWRGGRFVRSDGYIMVRVGGDYTLEHRHVMAQHLGRDLRSDEHVHHINHDRSDNRLENLELIDRAEHTRQHHTRPRQPDRWMRVQCRSCGVEFERRIAEVERHPSTYCSRECYRAGR